ncbi:MAG: restriction endonuclease subunit S, partial [Mailhella sp.]|nr:restriction endonuclease subunit S [Mailhella sp.]
MSYRLGEILTLQRGTTYKSQLLSATKSGIPLLGLGCIAHNGGFSQNGMKFYLGECPDKITLSSGDLLVSLKDLTQSCDLLGAVARIPNNIGKGRLTQDTVGLVFNNNTNDSYIKKYTYWSLRTPQYRQYCKSRGTGTTNMALSRDDFLSWIIPDKSASNDILINLLETIDDKIELNNKINDNLHQQAQALFKSWLDNNDFEYIPLSSSAYINKDFYSSKDEWSIFYYLDT